MSTVSSLVPIGTGIAANSSATITPIQGSMALDSTNATTPLVYCGNGTSWVLNGPACSDYTSAVTFTNGTNTFSGTFYAQSVTTGSFKMCYVSLVFNTPPTQAIVYTGSITVPTGFRPTSDYYVTLMRNFSGTIQTSGYFVVFATGALNLLYNNGGFLVVSGNYKH